MKEVREMWWIYGVLFEDKKEAEKIEDFKERGKKVYVEVDKSEGKVNGGSDLNYIFHMTRKHAEEEVEEWNRA